jgi:hypothetical protein
MKEIEQTSLIRIDAYSYTAILGEPGTKEIQAKADSGISHNSVSLLTAFLTGRGGQTEQS